MFLDIGVGIFLTFLTGNIFNFEPSVIHFALGVFFALLPDIDMLLLALPKEWRVRRFLGGHRGIVHRPIVYFALAPIVFALFGKVIGTMFVIGTFYHLFHDTVVLGWGIKWLWPFSQRSFRFFPDRDGKITNKFFITWLPKDEERMMAEYGSPNWVKDFYLTINPISIVEYSVFIVALVSLFLYFLG